jgi:Ca-activated chloride channel family protein
VRFRYSRLDPELQALLRRMEDLRKAFDELVLRTGGNVEEALRWMKELQRRGYIGKDVDLERFAGVLEKAGVIRVEKSRRNLTPRGLRDLRRGALDLMFRNLRGGPLGDHRTPAMGEGGERLPETRPWRFGDAVTAIDGTGTLREALARGGIDDISLTQDDFRVHETEQHASCATVLLLDVSHSMVLYGEDRITPAKKVAMALAELIETRYPKDSLDCVLFGDEARPVKVTDLPYVNAGPYHTNTREGLQLARRILRRRRHPNRRIVMVTDGKPSALTENGMVYKNPFGLDPHIVAMTLHEAVLCRRERIPITTFMIADDPTLKRFVEDMTRANKGQAYFASPDDLGGALFVDFLRNRRRRA